MLTFFSSIWICVCALILYSGISSFKYFFLNNFLYCLCYIVRIRIRIIVRIYFLFLCWYVFLWISILLHFIVFQYRYLSLCTSCPISYYLRFFWLHFLFWCNFVRLLPIFNSVISDIMPCFLSSIGQFHQFTILSFLLVFQYLSVQLHKYSSIYFQSLSFTLISLL